MVGVVNMKELIHALRYWMAIKRWYILNHNLHKKNPEIDFNVNYKL